MERPIGEILTDKNGVKLQVVKEPEGCKGCYYYDYDCDYPLCRRDSFVAGSCSKNFRKDRESVIFKKLNNE